MKLRPLAIVLFLFSPVTAANCSRRHRRTLSATTKKTSLNGWLPLPQAQPDSPDRSSSSPGPTSPYASLHSVDYSNSK